MIEQKAIIEDLITRGKAQIIADIEKNSVKSLHLWVKDKELLIKDIYTLIEYILEHLTGSQDDVVSAIAIRFVEISKQENIMMKELFAIFQEILANMEYLIIDSTLEDLQKKMLLKKLNKYFLELYKEITIHLDHSTQEQLQKKDDEMTKLHKDRMHLLSRLSNSFVHEIRNPLTSIKGFVQLLQNRSETLANDQMYFQYINQEIVELEDQVNQMIFLSNSKNHQDFPLRVISINDLIINAVKTFQPLIDEHNIQVELHLSRQVSIKGIDEQLKLAFYKLLQNAIDALIMGEMERKIRIQLEVVENQISIMFSNNGPPIPTLIKNNIFDPFVGTKELGKGIGLSITKQIIEKHNGTIKCYSKEPWTSFCVSLPISEQYKEINR